MSGTWSSATRLAPLNAGTVLLLTDGTLMAQDDFTADWWRLAPDAAGDYANGSWTQLAPAKYRRLYFASAVLADGRVFVGGGEYSADANTPSDLLASEIYDPETNSWTELPAPAGWTKMGDAPCCVLPDGTLLAGNIETGQCAIFDPRQMAWRAADTKRNASASEETWTLLPDGSVLAADCNGHPASERFVDGKWRDEGTIPADLVEAASIEIGPAVLLPDGTVFAIGATGNTAIFSPLPSTADQGTWRAGPVLPQAGGKQLAAKDAPACLLPNGKVLFVAGGVSGARDDYGDSSVLFEFDGTALAALAPQPANMSVSPYRCRLLMLPTGQAMLTLSSRVLQFYTPGGHALPAWTPVITQAPVQVSAGGSYVLRGKRLNGVSQACSYGDDASMATNYPLVRLWGRQAPARPTYCRTFGHSTMGVATGESVEATNFRVPAGMAAGTYDLDVVANGVASGKQEIIVKEAAPAPAAAGPVFTSLRKAADDYQLQEEMFWRDLNEVHMLMDFISGRADTSLTDLKDVPNPDAGIANAPATLLPQEALQRVCLIRFPPVGSAEQKARDAALLLLVKDRLNALAFPARGLSVAFTSMFAGTAGATPGMLAKLARSRASGGGGLFARIVDYVWGAPDKPPSAGASAGGDDTGAAHHVTGFAIASYPNLEVQAHRFRSVFAGLPAVALVWLVLTALTSWDLAISSQTLRTNAGDLAVAAQAGATDATCQIGMTGGARTVAAGGGVKPSAQACAALLRAELPAFYADDNDRRGLFIDHEFWHPIGFIVWTYGPSPPPKPAAMQSKGAPAACAANSGCNYDSSVAAFGDIVVSVFSDYVLPMMFGVLGTLAGLMRMISSKVRESTLSPRDYRLVYSLVPLGAVAGLAVGLVVTPSTVGSGNSVLTLSAAGLAFLAGYGADSFFAMIDGLLTRVFSIAPTQASGSK